MYSRVVRAVAGVVLLIMGNQAVASDALLELLGRLPTVEDVALSPAGSRLAQGTEWETDGLVDGAGAVAAYVDYNERDQSWSLHLHANQQMTQIAAGTAAIESPSMVGFTPDGASIVIESLENGNPVWKPLLLRDASWGPRMDPEKTLFDAMIDP